MPCLSQWRNMRCEQSYSQSRKVAVSCAAVRVVRMPHHRGMPRRKRARCGALLYGLRRASLFALCQWLFSKLVWQDMRKLWQGEEPRPDDWSRGCVRGHYHRICCRESKSSKVVSYVYVLTANAFGWQSEVQVHLLCTSGLIGAPSWCFCFESHNTHLSGQVISEFARITSFMSDSKQYPEPANAVSESLGLANLDFFKFVRVLSLKF